MVQLFYYECRGKGCRKILSHEGYPTKVLLFPYEGWARPAAMSYWVLKIPWWSRRKCKIIEMSGTTRIATKGKMTDLGNGSMTITGKFKDQPTAGPDFRLTLTTNVSNTDFQLGYSITGTLERGDRKKGKMEMTHFAMIKRKGY